MARKIEWIGFAVEAIRHLESQEGRPYVDTKTLASLLHISSRRAQQLMPIMGLPATAGSSMVVRKEDVLRYLRTVAAAELAADLSQRKKVAATLARLERERVEKPPLMVAPVSKAVGKEIERRGLDDLPEGVELRQGEITVRFRDGRDALEKFTALLIAIASHLDEFIERASGASGGGNMAGPPKGFSEVELRAFVAEALVRVESGGADMAEAPNERKVG